MWKRTDDRELVGNSRQQTQTSILAVDVLRLLRPPGHKALPAGRADLRLMHTATALSIYAAAVATIGLGWQTFTWRRARAFDVRAHIPATVRVGADQYEIVVVATNHGATHEAVQEIWLQYAEHGPVDRAQGAPSVRVTQIAAPELPPNRNVRVKIDLLGTRRHAPIATGEVTALVVLESGRHVITAPHLPAIDLKRLMAPDRR